MRGIGAISDADLSQQRYAVEAFLSALRAGDVDGLLAVLDPDVVRQADAVAVPAEGARELRGATAVVKEAVTHTDLAQVAQPALVDGSVGIVVAPRGRLRIVIRCAVKEGKIMEMEVIADPLRLRKLNLAILPD